MPHPARITRFALALVLGGGLATGLVAQDNDPDPEDLEQAINEEAPIVAFADPGRFVAEDGEALYNSICAGCHMPDGQGAVGAGAYPALAGNPMIEFPEYPVQVVIHGQNAMPAFGGYLDDAQVAAVVNYIRTNLGNSYTEDPATPEMASETR
ncbi:c-type cytochrome [Rubellimicrobium roseum]|uniref:Cytochrome c n=1 Tax=Rubellimicrobium roseum TaxID=687525 RepID=A0A5C4N7A4_9RHOB|nr:cytochrome c [Rubellimicrobium roseum]TNC62875.1 cytochrome c [Rubellimicrobium roseum]